MHAVSCVSYLAPHVVCPKHCLPAFAWLAGRYVTLALALALALTGSAALRTGLRDETDGGCTRRRWRGGDGSRPTRPVQVH